MSILADAAALPVSPGRSRYLQLAGHSTHCLEWGISGSPVLLLVHGYLAHAHWWDFVAPCFAEDYHVLAMDLGGMGDSGRRDSYSVQQFVAEIAAVAQAVAAQPVTVVGHSLGGRLTAYACNDHPDLIKRAVIVDAKLGFPDNPARPQPRTRSKKYYPDLAAGRARFRLMPDEPGIPERTTHMADHSLRREPSGYTWKFDENLTRNFEWHADVTEGEILPRLEMPVDFIFGEHSQVVVPELARRIGALLPRGSRMVRDAHHHIPVNQPQPLVASLRALLK